MSDVPREVAARIRRPAPPDHAVVDGSLPVISFGDYRTAKVATLALNPSSREFLDKPGGHLLGERRRLASLKSLGRSSSEQLTDEDVAQVFDDSNTYFGRNPLRPWFQWLEKLLTETSLGSYWGGTGCHLDLVQWATRPAQGKLNTDVWQELVNADRPFLTWQLEQATATTILVNGKSCVDWLENEGVVQWGKREVLTFQNARGNAAYLNVWKADQGSKRYLGCNVPVAQAIPASGRVELQEWVASASVN